MPTAGQASGWRSVRVKLMLPVVLAIVAVAALGTIQIRNASRDATVASQSATLGDAAAKVGILTHAVAAEYVRTNQLLRRSWPSNDLADLRGATNTALTDYKAISPEIRAVNPDLARLDTAAAQALNGLGGARALAGDAATVTLTVSSAYDEILTSLLTLLDAIPAQLGDSEMIELGRAISITAEFTRLTALQQDMISRGVSGTGLTAADAFTLQGWSGREAQLLGSLRNVSYADEAYTDLLSQPTFATADSLRQTVLTKAASDPASVASAVSPAEWTAALDVRIDGLWQMEQGLDTQLLGRADTVQKGALTSIAVAATIAGGVTILTLAIALTVALSMSRRLRTTRQAALTAAEAELPEAIEAVTAARDLATVRTALNDSSVRIDAMLPGGGDEIGELATAFGTVHKQALRLAADQATLRNDVQAMFVALSRRGQTLVQRQLHLLDEFGREETDPSVLERLYALDHLAARMRRNEENLLVLAGGEPGRWITRPVAVIDLLRAAAQEIEEFERVEIHEVVDIAIQAPVAGDAIHLLAELVENATNFSPPNTRVRIDAGRVHDGLLIIVSDVGIGMTPQQLAEANERVSRPSVLTSSLVGTMGLLVVSRLAQRHGIRIQLDSAPAQGTTARVLLPTALLAPLTPGDHLQAGRWVHGDERPALPAAPSPAFPGPSFPAPAALPPGSYPAPASVMGAPPPAAYPSYPTYSAPYPPPPPPQGPPPVSWPPAPGPAMGQPGSVPQPGAVPPPRHPAGPAMATPDPESVRARLSSLASGIAAANEEYPPPSEPYRDQRTR